MHSLLAAVGLALSFTIVLGAPSTLLTVTKFLGEVKPNSFIVKLKDGANKTAHLEMLQAHLDGSQIVYNYDSDFFNAFAGTFSNETLQKVRAFPDVEYIEEDGIVSGAAIVNQNNAPWGLSRLSQTERLQGNPNWANFTYRYDSTAGSGVDIYGIDTGIRLDHNEFGGRARWGATFGPYRDADGHGHGTHTAATAAGTRWGVAKSANVIAVKVLGDDNLGATSDIVAGILWVASTARASRRPSVANLSLGGPLNRAMDDAATALVANSRVHAAVAAGNSNIDAIGISPAHVSAVFTVGASNILDNRWFDNNALGSNFGSVVDIFAPGANIISAGIQSRDAVTIMSGTSMAAPHVAGLMAYIIGWRGNMPPADMAVLLHQYGTDHIVGNLPVGTPNELARNDIFP